MDKPQTPEQYRQSLFSPADRPHFAPYERMVERHAFYHGQAQKFAGRMNQLTHAVEAARQRFYGSLSDADYIALVEATAAHRKEADLRSGFNFDALLGSEFAPKALAKEFPNAADDLATVVRFMADRLTAKADRVRPIEAARLREADATLGEYGAADAPAPADERSPVLRDLLRTVAALEKIITELDAGTATFRSVGFHANPILAAIGKQTLS